MTTYSVIIAYNQLNLVKDNDLGDRISRYQEIDEWLTSQGIEKMNSVEQCQYQDGKEWRRVGFRLSMSSGIGPLREYHFSHKQDALVFKLTWCGNV